MEIGYFISKNSDLESNSEWREHPLQPIPLELPLEEPGWRTPPRDQEESTACVIEIDMC